MKNNGIIAIMRKELARFFGDKRMVVSILLPGVLIYVMYSFMGQAMGSLYGVDEDYVPTVQTVNLPDSVAALLEAAGGMDLAAVDESGEEAAKSAVSEQELDLLAVFPADFDQAVAAYAPGAGQAAPHVELYYNAASTTSQSAYMALTSLLDAYEAQLANKFDINAGDQTYDLASEKDTAGTYFASLMPLLLMIFLYSGCVAVAPESIAGEKERGTIATMLITPIRRGDIAIGKILALAVIAMLSGASSAVGTVLSLPKLMGAASDELSANIYHLGDYLLLAAVILSTVVLLVTLISILSAFAKTVKEAQTYVMPLMILVMVLGVTAMFGGGAKTELWYYLIPLYNSVQCMVGVFSFSTVVTGVAAALAANAVYTVLGVFVLTRMFNSEKIIFSR